MYQFIVTGEPQGKQRARHCRNGHVFTPQRTIIYEKLIRESFIEVGGMMMDGPIRMEITGFYQIPASAPKGKKEKMRTGEIRPQKKVDLDNLAKAVCDGLNGTAYKDDCSVTTLNIRKFYADEPCVYVTVKHDEDLNMDYITKIKNKNI